MFFPSPLYMCVCVCVCTFQSITLIPYVYFVQKKQQRHSNSDTFKLESLSWSDYTMKWFSTAFGNVLPDNKHTFTTTTFPFKHQIVYICKVNYEANMSTRSYLSFDNIFHNSENFSLCIAFSKWLEKRLKKSYMFYLQRRIQRNGLN